MAKQQGVVGAVMSFVSSDSDRSRIYIQGLDALTPPLAPAQPHHIKEYFSTYCSADNAWHLSLSLSLSAKTLFIKYRKLFLCINILFSPSYTIPNFEMGLSFFIAGNLRLSLGEEKKAEKMFRGISKVEIAFERIWGRREESACKDKCSCLSVVLRFRSTS